MFEYGTIMFKFGIYLYIKAKCDNMEAQCFNTEF